MYHFEERYGIHNFKRFSVKSTNYLHVSISMKYYFNKFVLKNQKSIHIKMSYLLDLSIDCTDRLTNYANMYTCRNLHEKE